MLAYRWRRLVVLSVTLIQIDASAVCVAYRDRQNREFGGSLIIEAAQLIRLAAKTLDSPINFYGAVYVLWRSLSLLLYIRSLSLSLSLSCSFFRGISRNSRGRELLIQRPVGRPSLERSQTRERGGIHQSALFKQTHTHRPRRFFFLPYFHIAFPHRSGLCLWLYTYTYTSGSNITPWNGKRRVRHTHPTGNSLPR